MLFLSQIQVKIIARDSLEEIAQLSLTIKEIEKAEIVFEERTVLNIYGKNKISMIFYFILSTGKLLGAEIFEATQQTLLLTNLKSYSLIDEGVDNKIRKSEIYLTSYNSTPLMVSSNVDYVAAHFITGVKISQR